ncbi:hypothetical protein MPSEU_000369000 [Mayamaea pseudoterrestris]|nr:hypothetical protein MPSEU_000369000 [Mayamaea pseudoterrestris]
MCERKNLPVRIISPNAFGIAAMELTFSWWWIAGIVFIVILTVAVIMNPLISLILHPVLLPYPWPLDDENEEQKHADKMRTVVFAASFDPPHLGHLRMLEYLTRKYGKVLVVIGRNPSKEYKVTPDQRADLVRIMLQQNDTNIKKDKKVNKVDNIQVLVVEGYVWRTVIREGASIFFRGIRTWESDGPDERALQILNTWGPLVLGPLWWPIPTVFMQGDPELNHLSSTLVRETCFRGSNKKELEQRLKKMVPELIVCRVASLYGAVKEKKSD